MSRETSLSVRLAPSVTAALARLGYADARALAHIGAAQAFLLLKAHGLTVTRSVLWQLDALARDVPLAAIDEARKRALQAALKQHTPLTVFPAEKEMTEHMQAALAEAALAAQQGEVPVGAVVVLQGKIIARGHNTCVADGFIAHHAELNALAEAARVRGSYRLDECDLYVTLEPCTMCAGAIMQSRVRRLIFAADEPKSGASGSVINVFAEPRLNHHTSVRGGVCAEQSKALLQQFFAIKREKDNLSGCLKD
ncbi:MAG: tRNA-specific adenosine deaminase [Neisseria sp.]|nr:tRNA-specific adenosine deaminase [Neisseria sp.]